jgi:hypothetical protein
MNLRLAFKNDRIMQSLTGVSIDEFNKLLVGFEQILQEKASAKKRQRKPGGGRRGAIGNGKKKLFFILFYFKVYPTFDLAGFIFGVDRSRPCKWYKALMPILETLLERKCVLPKRKISSIEEFERAFADVKDIFVDGTERRVQRPKNPKQQINRYSGKKKTHTRKNTIIADDKKRILLVSPTKNGKIHDKKQLDKEDTLSNIPSDVTIWTDTGYQGILKTVKNNNNVMMPKKKPKGKKLTSEEKEENRTISGLRIVVENAICGLKRFRCLVDVYRNKNGVDDMFIRLNAGLWNFHLAN